MTPPKARKAAQAAPAPQEDPLADLREPDETPGADVLADDAEPEPEARPLPLLEDEDGAPYPEAIQEAFRTALADYQPNAGVEVRPMVSQALWDDLGRESVVALHADTVALGFLHAGGACGCHYIAKTVLRHALPVTRPEDLEPHDLEPQGSQED